MSAQRGKDILLKIEGAAGVFTTVAGLRARTISSRIKSARGGALLPPPRPHRAERPALTSG